MTYLKLYTLCAILCALFFSRSTNAQSVDLENKWVDSVYTSLTRSERIAQLVMVRANVSGESYDPKVAGLISKYNIGGIVFFKGTAAAQLFQTNQWQSLAKTPLLVGIDGEWGLGMRCSDAVSYPFQMTLGAISNDSLIYQMGTQIAQQCQRMGIHTNFAPVADVNNNASNPVIGMRSFGDDPLTVSSKAQLYANALKDNGILATAKHFPGHGDTQIDSHKALPTISCDRAHLDTIELLPFRQMIENGLEGIMVAHLNVPALEPIEGLPSTLSKAIIQDVLQGELGFKGIVVSDALDMKGVTNGLQPGEIGLKAFVAGNDILLIPSDVPETILSIEHAILTGGLSELRLETSCKKILHWKYRSGLSKWQKTKEEHLVLDLQNTEYHKLVYDLYREAVSLLKDDNLINQIGKPGYKIATLSVGYSKTTGFQHDLTSSGLHASHFQLPKNADAKRIAMLKESLSKFNLIVISIQNTNILANKKFGIEDQAIKFVNDLMKTKETALTLFASPYSLNYFTISEKCKAVLVAYQDNDQTEKISADILMGRIPAKGHLPVSVNEKYTVGAGITSGDQTTHSDTTEMSVNQYYLDKIDSVAKQGIDKKAFPGCEIMALKNGNVIYRKCFGFHTYENRDSVAPDDVYDLASLTKILASTLAIMKLYEDHRLSLDDTLGKYFPYLHGTTKGKLKLIDIMTHQAGLDGWIPFYLQTFTDAGPDPLLYSSSITEDHPLRVASDLFIRRNYKNMIFNQIAESKMKSREYRYSDLGFYFVPDLVEQITNEKFDVFVDKEFYQPLGLHSTGFRPLTFLPKNRLVPTENDTEFRHQLLQGDVHDYGAALLGGISGHAGLFANVDDVSVIMQMLLNGGEYKGKKYFKPETIQTFTSAPFAGNKNRRGIGFDKPPLDKNEARMPAMEASALSFGHSGFTGTFAWADPENGLVFVFLSNRIHPDANNSMISKLNTRTVIHELLYKACKP